MTPTVSILIPAYNAEAWVTQAVESALAQGPDVEVIVVDDGSTDGTVERLLTFDGRIGWESSLNRGAPATRNRLLQLARAEWVQYLDADDYLLPGKTAGQLAALNGRADVDVLYGPVTVEWHGPDEPNQSELPIPAPHDPWRQLALWQLPQTGSPLWRRSALMDVGGWRQDQPCCQEHELYLRMLIAGKRFMYHPTGGAVYRRFSGGTLSTRNMARVRAERFKIERRLEEYLAATGQLTPERQWAIDQACFEMARSAWSEDRVEARMLHASIRSRGFQPIGVAAPPAYRVAYRLFGFEAAEQLALLRRKFHALTRIGREEKSA